MLDKLRLFWEDQHTLVRANVSMGSTFLIIGILLHLISWLAVRILDTEHVFRLLLAEQLFHTLLLLLLAIMLYNALRLTIQWMRGRGVATAPGIALAIASLLLIIIILVNMPGPFKYAVAYQAGRSYGSVYGDFETLCRDLDEQWAEDETITLNVGTDMDAGELEKEAKIYRLRNTIVFNFSDTPDLEFGLACVLQKQEPVSTGQASNYVFHRIDGPAYWFVEEQS